MNAKKGHFGENLGHKPGTLPRACARPYGDTSRVSHCPSVPKNGTGHTVGWDRTDRPEGRPSRPPASGLQPKTSWMHIAAMNLVADHDAGKQVDASKLELARRLLGQPYAPARICTEEA